MAETYLSGRSLASIARDFGVSNRFVSRVLAGEGVAVRKGSKQCKISHCRDQIKHDLMACVRHSVIAAKYGISRERVRQLAKFWGMPTGREVRAKVVRLQREQKQKLKEAERQAREASVIARYAKWRDMWMSGMPLQAMADALGISAGSASVRMHYLRRRFPGWFPYRNKLAHDVNDTTKPHHG